LKPSAGHAGGPEPGPGSPELARPSAQARRATAFRPVGLGLPGAGSVLSAFRHGVRSASTTRKAASEQVTLAIVGVYAGAAVIAMAVPAAGSSKSRSSDSALAANSVFIASAPGIKLTSPGVDHSNSAGETVRVRLELVTAGFHGDGSGNGEGF
jgi:hypothetical protein